MTRYWKDKGRDKIRLTADQAKRQGTAARLAWETLPNAGAAVAFLNTFNQQLGGRPIDLAVTSDAGLQAVETELGMRRHSGKSPCF